MDVDVAILGGGGAGLTLLDALCAPGAPTAAAGLRIAVLDPVRHCGNDRTWCFWDDGTSPVDEVLHRSWHRLAVRGPDGTAKATDTRPMRYVMVRSADFYARVARRADTAAVTWIDQPAEDLHEDPDGVRICTPGGTVRARWVFDSRPTPPRHPGVTTLLQHFRGWWVHMQRDTFDPHTATLMDFALPQPPTGLAFCYVMPLDARRALVEYTVFSRQRHDPPHYDRMLADYLSRLCGPDGYRTTEVEDGAIPMTDAPFARRAGRRVLRIGTAGGATRPATGYTFATMLRQATVIAARLAAGADPVPPRPYPRRHALFDGVLLRALDAGLVDGPRYFTDLLTGHPIDRVLRFLDGRSGIPAELAIMAGAPPVAMTRATAGFLVTRAAAAVRRWSVR